MSRPAVQVALQRSALVCCVWLAAAAGYLALAGLSDGTVVATGMLPDPVRRTLVAFELVLLFGFTTIFVLVALALDAALAFVVSRRLAWVGTTLFATLPIGLYGVSWAAYRSSGRFLDSHGFDFMAASPVQFMQHVVHIESLLLATIPIVLLLATLSFTALIPFALSRAGKPLLVAIHAIFVVAFGTCVVFALDWNTGALSDLIDYIDPNEPVVDPDAGLVYNYNDLYIRSRDEASGPLSHAYADYRESRRVGARLRTDPRIAIEYPPIVSIEEYVAGIDPNSIERKNVIVVVVESLRPDQLQAFGGSREVMPNTERIAAESRRYTDHYAQASHSNYADICLLSSHYPLRSDRAHVYPKNPTYPRVLIYDVLKPLGWHTAVVSSQNENWGQMINYLRTGNIDHFFHSETFSGETYVPRNDEGFEDFLVGGKRSGKIDDRFTISEAIRWIDSVDDGRPFFMYLNLQNSHLPYETPADFERPFGPDEIDFAIRFSGYPQDRVDVVKDLYADSLAYIDFQFGRLVDHLKAVGKWDDTIVVLTGDTGQAFGEHGFVAHANMIFDETVRVPLVVRAAGLEPGNDDRPAQHIDIPPTVLDLLGLPPHPGMQGVSLVDPDPHSGRTRYLVVQTPIAHQYGLVWHQFKLIHDVNYDRTLLIDRSIDPNEMNPVGPQRKGLQSMLKRRLDTWRQAQIDYYRDTQLHAERYPPKLAD